MISPVCLSREKGKISRNREGEGGRNRDKKLHITFFLKCAGKRTVRAKDTTINPLLREKRERSEKKGQSFKEKSFKKEAKKKK
jgi:hypothetical protein